VHHGHTPEIEITGKATARGIWAMIDYATLPAVDGRRPTVRGSGHYHEEYVKQDDRWRIARLVLTRLRVDYIEEPEGEESSLRAEQAFRDHVQTSD
jgi:hypothetical protein